MHPMLNTSFHVIIGLFVFLVQKIGIFSTYGCIIGVILLCILITSLTTSETPGKNPGEPLGE